MLSTSYRSLLAATVLFATHSLAQTTSSCNPTEANVTIGSCPSDAALGTTFSQTFDASTTAFSTDYYNITAGESLISFGSEGAALPITAEGDSVTIQTNFYIFFGTVEIVFKAAAGQGIVSTMNLLSDDLDEIDWEILGGNVTNGENNYYGMGNTSQYNSEWPKLDDAHGNYYNYTIDWTQEKIDWLINGTVIRSVPYAAAGQYPQTPCYVKFGIWAGGDPNNSNGTIEWAGGETDYSKGPFTMYVASLRITDGTTNSSSYSYDDRTGSFSSIKVVNGESKVYKALNKLSDSAAAKAKWTGLSTTQKIAIACGVIGGVAVIMVAWCSFCCVQRRKGRKERAIADQEWTRQENELMDYRRQMVKGNFAVSHLSSDQVKY